MPYNTTHESVKSTIFSESGARLAFKLGVAHAHQLLPKHLLDRWIKFLAEDLASIHFGDILLEANYQDINIMLRELRRFVDGPKGPSSEQIEDAERAAPNPKDWKPPFPEKADFDVWKFEVRQGTKTFEPKEKILKTDKSPASYEVDSDAGA
ncbi:hypothetical protein HYFRA_00006476 [Hymenoscyphus fraxineus]|uniref:Uncharacterized protein n=1 Tax=Hymenoscyphus fraxineus TaxID=746836 RepID=A0A9N9KQ77_9HELO|nr:hypothetical protein HYFRA_00006476 [Hymenoscyphus fraxineus]